MWGQNSDRGSEVLPQSTQMFFIGLGHSYGCIRPTLQEGTAQLYAVVATVLTIVSSTYGCAYRVYIMQRSLCVCALCVTHGKHAISDGAVYAIWTVHSRA